MTPLRHRLDSSPRDRMAPSPRERVAPSPRDRMAPSPRDRMAPSARDQVAPSPRERVALSPRGRVDPSARDQVAPSPRGRMALSPRGRVAPSPRGRMAPSPRGRVAPTLRDRFGMWVCGLLWRPRFLTGLVVILGALCLATVAMARPGGGHGYSGSSGGGGGGGGGGDSDGLIGIFVVLLQLCFEQPVVGVPLMVVFLLVAGYVIRAKTRQSGFKDWESGSADAGSGAPSPAWNRPAPGPGPEALPLGPGAPRPGPGAPQPGPVSPSEGLEAIRGFDPNFSAVLFGDFLYSLYGEVHRARGGNRLDHLSAFLAPAATAALAQRPALEVSSVLLGAMHIRQVTGLAPPATHVQVVVDFEANITETRHPQGRPEGLYTHERWHLWRRHGPLSPPPDRATVLSCPNCSAPLDVVTAGICGHCGQQVNSGAYHWTVMGVELVSVEARGPLLTADVEEKGTHLPTRVHPEVNQRLRALGERDSQFRMDLFQARLGLIFSEFQTAWSARDLAAMRPYLSDRLFGAQVYWVEAYRAQRLRNITENARITGVEVAKVTSDRFFDAITVRIWATGLDYTVTEEGKVISGSRRKERAYSEYWTLIRGTGTTTSGRVDKTCPKCGAPLQINMSGYCEYCQGKVTSGEFDWVLSQIEQDDSYRGN